MIVIWEPRSGNTVKQSLEETEKDIHVRSIRKTFKGYIRYNTVLVFPTIISIDEYNCPVKWAETGSIYIECKHPEIFPPAKEKPIEKPGNSFRIEYI